MWNNEKSQKVASKNSINAQKQDIWHATRKKPIPVLKQQSGLEDAIGDMPSELQEDPDAREKLFVDTFGKDTYGRMRCMGQSITPTMIYGRRSGLTSVESVTNVRAEFEEKMEMQKQEMEARIQVEREAMEARIQAERDTNRLEMEAFKKEIFLQLQSQRQS